MKVSTYRPTPSTSPVQIANSRKTVICGITTRKSDGSRFSWSTWVTPESLPAVLERAEDSFGTYDYRCTYDMATRQRTDLQWTEPQPLTVEPGPDTVFTTDAEPALYVHSAGCVIAFPVPSSEWTAEDVDCFINAVCPSAANEYGFYSLEWQLVCASELNKAAGTFANP